MVDSSLSRREIGHIMSVSQYELKLGSDSTEFTFPPSGAGFYARMEIARSTANFERILFFPPRFPADEFLVFSLVSISSGDLAASDGDVHGKPGFSTILGQRSSVPMPVAYVTHKSSFSRPSSDNTA